MKPCTWRDWSADLPEDTNTSIAFLQLPPLPDVPPPLAGKFTVKVDDNQPKSTAK